VFGLASKNAIGALCAVIAVVLGLLAYLDISTAEFGVTNRRVIIKVGVLRRRTLETLLDKVESISVDQGILGRVFGYGTVAVNGTGAGRTPFKGIAAPLQFRQHVQEQIEATGARAAKAS